MSRVYFEPWSLGDAVIAACAWAFFGRDEDLLVIHSRWKNIITHLFSEKNPALICASDLSYTHRQSGWKRQGPMTPLPLAKPAHTYEVLSIRGDFRDRRAAAKLFPGAKWRSRGLPSFLGWRSALFDLPYAAGILPVENRYISWQLLLSSIGNERTLAEWRQWFSARSLSWNGENTIAIHVGAQYRSKQYPHIARVIGLLRAASFKTVILAGPGDPLPDQISESEVVRTQDLDLLARLRAARVILTNDSGPMHVAASLGANVLGLGLPTNLDWWKPISPHFVALKGESSPRGYHPRKDYLSDRTLPGWPTPEAVFSALKDLATPMQAWNAVTASAPAASSEKTST